MSDRYNFSNSNSRYPNENLHSSRRPHAERTGLNGDSNASYSNSRVPRDDISDSSSEEGLGEFVTSRDCESDSDSGDSTHSATYRRGNRMGGLERAAEEMFINGLARRAEQARLGALRGSELTERLRRRGREAEVIHHSHGGTEVIHPGQREGQYAQVDDDGRLHRLSEPNEDSLRHRLSRRRLGRQNADSSSGSSDVDSEYGTAPQDYEGRGASVRGDDDRDGYPFPYTPRGYSGRAIRARRGEYGDDGDE